jgi:predicted enzyme related to lactoylglutathione lyase
MKIARHLPGDDCRGSRPDSGAGRKLLMRLGIRRRSQRKEEDMTAGVSFDRLILYVRDVDLLAGFYGRHFGLAPSEHDPGEWAVLGTPGAEIGLLRMGKAFRHLPGGEPGSNSNAKLVFTVDDVAAWRERLTAAGVPMRAMKSYPGTGPLCDGHDPEGNVFQLMRRG